MLSSTNGFMKPLWRCCRRIRNNGIGSTRESHSSVRCFAVTIPASFPLVALRHHVVNTPRIHQFGVQLGMTTDAVIHYHFRTRLFEHDNIFLAFGHKGRHVSNTIFRFEIVLCKHTAVRNMTIVTRCSMSMRTMCPCSLIRCHHMTVHARCWVIPQISSKAESI